VKIRSQADADLHYPIVKGIQRQEPLIDFQSAQEADWEGLDDLTVLELAADGGRLLVSHDVTTMPENFAQFIAARTSPGVVPVTQELAYHLTIERLIKLWREAEAEQWENVLFFLPS
jgi:hypothetical protein